MTEAGQLQEHLNRMRTGWPLVTLTHGQATEQAKRLRTRGMTYSGIAHAMAAYHGYWLTPMGWRYRLRGRTRLDGGTPNRRVTRP